MSKPWLDAEIAPRLKYREVMDPDAEVQWCHVKLLQAWTKFRVPLGAAIKVNSGCRTPATNLRVGGSETSLHLFGRALDMQCAVYDLASQEMFFRLIRAGFRGIGRPIGGGWVHADTRETATFWSYDSGRIVADDEALDWFGSMRIEQ